MDSFTLDKLEFDRVRQILARYCRCSLGADLARRISASRRPETVRRWLEETSQMVKALRDFGPPPFGGVSDIAPRMARAVPGGAANGEDFSVIASCLDAIGAIRRWGEGLEESLGLVRQMVLALSDFAAEVQAIRGIVDERGAVKETASDTLYRVRREQEAAQQRIHDVIYNYVRQPAVAKILQNPTVMLHDDRYVLPVKAERRGELSGVVHRTSDSGATVFVEPAESVELNNRLVELRDAERREVARLLDELAIRVNARHAEVAASLRRLAQLDLLTAKAEYAYQFECTCPEMTERGGVQLHQVRHPLLVEQAFQQERAGLPAERRHAVVPIDVRLGADFDVLLITGSNTGGKTVALKTVGLAAMMAQSGLHIPAQRGSSLPIFRDVLLDVGDEQSLQQSLSTFGAHIRRVNNILRRADRYSLVLLDELGSGTDPDEGGAIGQAVLDEFRRISCLAMVTTHLGVLKAYAFNHERIENASVEFDTRTLRPTYHLRIGEPGESHAITVAAAMGLPRHLIGSARRHLQERGAAFRRAIRATSATRRASELARTEAHAARQAAQTAQEQYAGKLSDLKQMQERFEHWLASLSEMREGDKVQVPQLNKPGRLVRMEFNKQIALVDVDNLQVEVPLSELLPNLGQEPIRREIATMRDQIRAEARSAENLRRESQRLQAEYHRSLQQQRARQEQYDRWLAALAAAKVGDEVAIAVPPGSGTLIELDLLQSRSKVRTGDGELELKVQDLFPQTGPFAPHHKGQDPQSRRSAIGEAHPHRPAQAHGPSQSHGPHPPGGSHAAAGKGKPIDKDRPIQRRRPDSVAGRANRAAILRMAPGQLVYVVPFHKRATLIRFNEAKDQAVVSAGAFEMTLPLADLEPVREPLERAQDAKPQQASRPPRPQSARPQGNLPEAEQHTQPAEPPQQPVPQEPPTEDTDANALEAPQQAPAAQDKAPS